MLWQQPSKKMVKSFVPNDQKEKAWVDTGSFLGNLKNRIRFTREYARLEEGESPEEALIREIYEELNSKIEIISFVNEASYDYDFGTVVMKTFHAKLVCGNLDLLEHQDSVWLEPSRLKTLNWAPVDRLAVELLSK